MRDLHLNRGAALALSIVILLAAAAARLTDLGGTPPGLHFDEAANALITRGIAFEGYRPLFIEAFTGKKTLWFYAAGLMTRLGGSAEFTLRLTSAYFGVLTVAAAGWAVRRLYTGDARRRWLSLLTMAVLAGAFWHLVLSRLAFRAISQPLLQALALGLLFAGLRAKRPLPWMLAAGAAAGLTAYTYLAARLFPVPLAVGLLVLLIAERERLSRVRTLLVYGAAALIAFAPLGVYFLRNPERFSTRITQVAPATPAEALEGWRLALGMFFVQGDPLLRFNIPGRPLFGVVLGLFFVVGLAVVLRDLITTRDPVERARGALLLVWPLAMLAPTALATGGITPSNLRAVGLAPLIALYPALGVVAVVRFLPKQVSGATLLAAVLAVGVGGTIANTLDLVRWGDEAQLYYDNDGHAAALADYLNTAPEAPTYVASYHFRHPTLLFLSERGAAASALFGGEALVLAPEGRTLITYTRDAPPPEPWRDALSPWLEASPAGPDGSPDYYAYLLDGDTLPPFWPEPAPVANFASLVTLEGATLLSGVSGERAVVQAAWQVIGFPTRSDYVFVAEVCDPWGWCWLQANQDGTVERGRSDTYLSSEWQLGERVLTWIEVPLPPGMPPGTEYTVRLRVFSTGEQTSLPLIDAAGGFAGFTAEVGPLRITAPDGPTPAPVLEALPVQNRLEQPVGEGIMLYGYDLPNPTLRPGERLQFALYWLSSTPLDEDLPVTVLLGGRELLQRDPVHGTTPTSVWEPGQLLIDRYDERLPADLPPGELELQVRLGDSEPVRLGTLTIEEAAREFTVPGGLTPTDAVFGGQVALVGYDLPTEVTPGASLEVTLVWRALASAEQAYTTFVHFIDDEGQIVAQRDRIPLLGGRPYPADLWIPDEVVPDDPYRISVPPDLPPGVYRVRVGVYIQETGQRLALPGSEDNALILPEGVTVVP